eukprot:Phypoly_transcript_21438.p1 GENE.Phypoly_transcript_21438~~Phypoly_transcript_21438.p1  ORF type:complete len:181 (+),score=20.80 Phypoly_transcript_21438:40-582(+)
MRLTLIACSEVGMRVIMDPDDIHFTQKSIRQIYSNFPLSIYEHVQGLSGSDPVYKVTDFPPIRVAKIHGEYCSIDNRRLWVLRESGISQVVVELMQPTLEFHEKLRGRKGDGTSVAIKKEVGSNLIPSLLKLSFCPTHKSEGMLGWKVAQIPNFEWLETKRRAFKKISQNFCPCAIRKFK